MGWNRGQELFGSRYIIEGKLGEGGIGITYLAKNRRGELWVIKTLREEILNNPVWIPQQGKLKQNFIYEGFRLGLCRHSHIVQVDNFFDHDDLPCIVMEYIPGEDLKKRITQKGALPETEALLYIRQIGDALTLVHEKGLLHRDLKPGNIMIREGKQEAVLIDFGLARQFIRGDVQQHTEYLTHGYAPPEQYLRHAERGEYIDVYALAATLYALITGELPIPAPGRTENLLTPPQELNPNISDRVNEAIMKGMELNYQSRPQSVQQWLDLLGAGIFPPTQPVINPISYTQPTQKAGFSLQTFSFETVTVDAQGYINNRQHLQAQYFIEDLGNGITLEMVYIPGGTFKMGSAEEEGEKGRCEDEGPQHTVTVQPFFMSKYPITQEQYQATMGENPSKFKGEKRPVESVSWSNAVRFCQRLSLKTKGIYKLPSEAQWEYAVRAGTTTPFHFGETITTDLANYKASFTYAFEAAGIDRKETTDVGIFPPNAFGLYDMHGNVWEWCQDTWHSNYKGAPTDGSPWIDYNNNEGKVVRGGSWFYYPSCCRCAYRENSIRAECEDIYDHLGFRVVCAFGM
ncbi:MAG: bifunctional serine/threonine-protein kinase/formylglycine-generating enzyme family protein [Nostocaceae cyanobacterium]|nr:bifunctional serine/threonine-protein kinase/formylglycine-generating enzyme family protein [Nostocaceae cyanobacterium]